MTGLQQVRADAVARLRAASADSNLDEIAVLLSRHGDALVYGGQARLVAESGRLVLPTQCNPRALTAMGLAFVVLGDSEEAERVLRLTAAPLTAAQAWRLGMLRHLGGAPAAALEVMRPALEKASGSVDDALLLGWAAAASWMLGDEEGCSGLADRAHEVAARAGCDVAVAAAQSALALAASLRGDRRANACHWHRALEAAVRGDDLLQQIRIRTNIGSHLLEEGRYAAAVEDLAAAAQLARQVEFAAMQGLSSNNLGECLFHLGRLDDAATAFEEARSAWQRTGSRMIAYALTGLGDTYRERDDLVLAKAAYEEAVQVSAERDPQGMVPALDGLARVLGPDDPQRAWTLAVRAETLARGIDRPKVRLTLGWLRLAEGDGVDAALIGRNIAEDAERRRDNAALGESLELQAMTGDEPRRRRLLTEALAVWQHLGDVLGMGRVAYAIERLTRGGGDGGWPGSSDGVPGCRPAATGLRAAVDVAAGPRVEVRVLGRFEVLRDGAPVSENAWQSRKARELLRVLIARRGRPIGRDTLIETLWPDEDPGPLANRLSVALAVIRRVLDPQRTQSVTRFIRAEDGVVAVAYDNLCVDVEVFLQEVAAGLACKQSDPDQARRRLRRALDLYAGEALAEDLYADWALALRSEAAAANLAAARALAELSVDDDPAAAVAQLMKVLRDDAYDEPAHLLLVRAFHLLGSFGEARKAYRRYAGKMTELGLAAAPLPAVQRGT